MTPAAFEPVTVAEWPRNSRETMRVRLDTFQGRFIIDCRAWFVGQDGELKPGRNGMTLAVRHLPALASAFDMAMKEAQRQGIE
jgi:hypothetical protein